MTNYYSTQMDKMSKMIDWDNVKTTSDSNKIAEEYHYWINGLLDVEAVKWMSEICAEKIAGYMVQPVALYNGKPLAAKVYSYENIEDVKNIEGKIFLYEITYFPKKPQYFSYDEKTLSPIANETLQFSIPKWKVRYGIVEENI